MGRQRQRLERYSHEAKSAWSCQKLEEARKDSPIRAFGGEESAQPTRVLTSCIQNCERINFCYFQPLSL